MAAVDIIGFAGVAILLIAFALQLIGKIKRHSFVYLFLNFIGAAIACYASVLLHYTPFILLESIWAMVSLWGMIKWRNDSD